MTRVLALLFTILFALWPATITAQDSDNPHGALKQQCADCHRADGWKPAKVKMAFRHADETFPLEGAHARATCTSCHKSLDFAETPSTCASCHSDVHRGELGAQCASCHNARSFVDRGTMLSRHQTGRFPLEGAHARATCESCHATRSPGKMQFVNQPTTCFACHAADYRAAKDPDHALGSFPQDCTSCHTVASWSGAAIDHSLTRFPLVGSHQAVGCLECHRTGVYRGTPLTCAGCHDGDYSASTNPHHAAAGFATQCESCHALTTWPSGTYDHAKTAFPLTGAHIGARCESCHGDAAYKGRPATCVACHRTAYDNVQTPPHASAGLPTTCESCHSTTSWKGAAFDHSTTAFALTGAHRATSCLDCHKNNIYKGTPSSCESCHNTDYSATTNPHHAAAGFLTQCQTCHTTTAWPGATYDHNATAFPLTGAHQTSTCISCHADRVYDGKPITCISCHQTAWSGTTNPPHQAAGFPTTCESCHTTTQWPGGTFNHSATLFPLTGAHVTTPCAGCHGDGIYKGKPTQCISCHQADYNGTTTPNHAGAGFPTTCVSCHTTTQWQGATFDHDGPYFPIYSGAHKDKWSSCATCHTSPSNYAVFTCLTCHEHSQSVMDSKHQGRAGYSYVSTACYSCHPRGTH